MLNRKEYLLACLSEECAEIQQLVGKSLRFGLDSFHPQDVEMTQNHIKLRQELNDLLAIVTMLDKEEGIFEMKIWDKDLLAKKFEKVEHFMEVSKELGKLEK